MPAMHVSDLSPELLLLIGVAAFTTGTLHGATGMAGGVVMAALLSHILGIKAAVPVVTWLGRAILRRMEDADHRLIVHLLTMMMAVNFIYLAIG